MPHCLAGQIVKLQIGLIKKLDLEILDPVLFAVDHHFHRRVGGVVACEGHLGRGKSTIKSFVLMNRGSMI